MNTCPFRTATCGLSRPCHKCRDVAISAAHVLVRFDSRGKHRGTHSQEHTHYQTKRGGYWEQ